MTVNMGTELSEELKNLERPRKPTVYLIGQKPDGSWKTAQAKEYPRAMSAGIAAAMVRAACKHPRAQTDTASIEATRFFEAFQPQLLHTPEVFGADFVDSIAPVQRFIMQWTFPNN